MENILFTILIFMIPVIGFYSVFTIIMLIKGKPVISSVIWVTRNIGRWFWRLPKKLIGEAVSLVKPQDETAQKEDSQVEDMPEQEVKPKRTFMEVGEGILTKTFKGIAYGIAYAIGGTIYGIGYCIVMQYNDDHPGKLEAISGLTILLAASIIVPICIVRKRKKRKMLKEKSEEEVQ
jgi:hypothetical protein